MKINVFNTEDEVLTGLAEYFVKVAKSSIADHGQFSVALSGGNSPKKLYELLASSKFRDKVEWSKVHFFFGDERYVPQTDPQSNYLARVVFPGSVSYLSSEVGLVAEDLLVGVRRSTRPPTGPRRTHTRIHAV